MTVPPAPVRIPTQCSFSASVKLGMCMLPNKTDNEMPGAMHRSRCTCLTTEENPGKPQLGDHR